MAHLLPQQAIFSPTAARLAATAQKDWNQVDTWLASRLGPRLPVFERNPETLRVLLALANANEAADEERDLLASVERDALDEIVACEAPSDGDGLTLDGVRNAVLGQAEDGLSKEGRMALEALAKTALALGMSDPDPEALGRRLVELHGDIFGLDTAASRVEVLRRHLEVECVRLQNLLAELEGEEYRPAPDLARNNLEIQRRLKVAGDVRRAGAGRRGPEVSVTAEEVREMEEELLELLKERSDLDGRVRAFQGLPPDTDAAREELEKLRDELSEMTRRRDAVFEGLVERETPRKPRR
jgi:HAUS augmin-like complex subunit 1